MSRREQRKRDQSRRRSARRSAPRGGRDTTDLSAGSPRELTPQQAQAAGEAIAAEARSIAERLLADAALMPGMGTPERAPADASTRRAVALADATRDFTLRVLQGSPQHGRHECRAGCAYCCHTAVTIAPPESFAILGYLRAHFSPDELAQVRARLDANAETAARQSRAAYAAARVPCALLTDDGNCRAHPVRPLACAGFLSTSRDACQAEFDRVFGRRAVPIDRFGLVAGVSASYGLREACTAAGLDGDFYELHHLLRRAWDRPAAANEWASGSSPFEGCLRAADW